MREDSRVRALEVGASALGVVHLLRKPVRTEHDIERLLRHDDHLAGSRLQDILVCGHDVRSLPLRLLGKRHVDCHLVAVEVGVERRTDERMKLNSVALDKARTECLDTLAMERRCTVKQDMLALDRLFKDLPHLGDAVLDEAARTADVEGELALKEPGDDERAEELERHVLRKTALIELEVRTDNDHGASRVVDALTEKVLAEVALLALEVIGKRLQGTALCRRERAT